MPKNRTTPGGETGYANNKIQWFFEKQVGRMAGDLSELADEMYEEIHQRGWSPQNIDWAVVEAGLKRFLAAQATHLVADVRDKLKTSG